MESYRIRQKLLKVINLYQLVEKFDIHSDLIKDALEDFTKTFQIHVMNLVADYLKEHPLSDV